MAGKKADAATAKKAGLIRQKQKDYFAMKLHSVGGDFSVEQMSKVIEVAKAYGNGQIHLTTRQGIEIHFVHHTVVEAAMKDLETAGIAMGAGGPRVRIVSACPGDASCTFGAIDTKGVALHLDREYFNREMPYKFKLAVTGCPHNCAKATENDIGVMGGIEPEWDRSVCRDCKFCVGVCPKGAIEKEGDAYVLDRAKCINCSVCTATCPTNSWRPARQGYILWIGGTMGKTPRMATRLPGLIESRKRLFELIAGAIDYYRNHGRKKERFGHTVDRIGPEKVLKAIYSSLPR